MQVTEVLSDGLKRGFAVVVPAADVEDRRAKRLAELGRTLRLPGFRPGKIPPTVIRQRYGKAVAAEAVEESVSSATQQLLTDRGLRAATQPRIEVVTLDPAKDLEFKLEFELLPEIALPEFSAIEITRLKAEPSEEQVASALADLCRRQRELVDEEPRAAVKGDFLTVDFTGKLEGNDFPGGTGSNLDIEVGGPGFIPGFTEQLEGVAPGESRTVEVAFPEGYPNKDLAGKPATFEVSAKKLKRAVVPEADDALAAKIGFENLAELKGTLKGRFQRELDQMARLRLKRQLLDALAATVSFPVPQGMVEGEFNQIWQRLDAERKQGRLDAEDVGKDDETLKGEYRAIAERRVRLGLLLAEIGRQNGITVAEDELNRAMRAEAGRYPGQEQKVMELFRKTPQAVDTLRGPIFEEKVVDFVLELAKVTDTTVTPEELARDPEGPAAPAAAAPAPESTAPESRAPEPTVSESTAPESTAPEPAAPEAG